MRTMFLDRHNPQLLFVLLVSSFLLVGCSKKPGRDFEQARFFFDPEGSYGKVYSQQGADHPNTVEIDLLSANGRRLRLSAKSTGGGAIGVIFAQRATFAAEIAGCQMEIGAAGAMAAAASAAFICADLILGGYPNPIPLDETVDTAYEVGKSLPAELRCTALGGLAATPSALSLKRRSH